MDGSKHWITIEKLPRNRAIRILFRRHFFINICPDTCQLLVSADSRYKLYVNGRLVEAGPCKGDREVWYYDTLEIAPYLIQGDNVLAVEVLSYPIEHGQGSYSIFRTGHPGLFLLGEIKNQTQSIQLSDVNEWRGYLDEGFEIVKESEIFAPLQILEKRRAIESLTNWTALEYDDTGWQQVIQDSSINPELAPGNLLMRPIPFLYRKRKNFVETQRISEQRKREREAVLGQDAVYSIPAGEKRIWEFDAGEEETGFLHLIMTGGAGSCIRILTSEGYVQQGFQGDLHNPIKKDRTDKEHGYLHGFSDIYYPAGNGTIQKPEEYVPFWFRTFRFIRLEIETKETPITLLNFYYEETGYPLEVETQATADDSYFPAIWEISERTLRRCMHETYEDCPFYEQLQYVMDARTQILYTYAVGADDKLARKCIDDFSRAQRYDGLLNSSHPNYESNVIPGYSIFYILMLHDHMMYFGDKELIRRYFPQVDRILGFFHRNLTPEGYVGSIGGKNGAGRFWSFIDWTPQWDSNSGVPNAAKEGAITMESLYYVYGLQTASELAAYLELEDMAQAYRAEAVRVQKAIREYMYGNKGMLTDGPGVEEYSQHTQVFAVLTGTIEGKEAREALWKTIEHKEKYAQCSVAMVFYLFRAMEKTQLYEYTKEYWEIWKRMLAKHSTTCIEDETQERSDCHAWGALLLYELPCVILGVRPKEPGCKVILINPNPGYLHEAHGTVVTPLGKISVAWERKGTEMFLTYHASEDIHIVEE